MRSLGLTRFLASKFKLFDAWMKYEEKLILTKTFQNLCDEPRDINDDQIVILEIFIVSVYFPKMEVAGNINVDRMNAFRKNPNCDLRLIPFSRPGLVEHTKRACIQGCWLWKQGIKNIAQTDPLQWGWSKKNDKFVPKWQFTDPSLRVEDACTTCACTTTCKKCKCSRGDMKCLTFCRCESKCLNSLD